MASPYDGQLFQHIGVQNLAAITVFILLQLILICMAGSTDQRIRLVIQAFKCRLKSSILNLLESRWFAITGIFSPWQTNLCLLWILSRPWVSKRQHHSTSFKGAVIYNMKLKLHVQTKYFKNSVTTLHIKKAIRDAMCITGLFGPVETKVLKIIKPHFI